MTAAYQVPHRSGGLVGECDSRDLRWATTHALDEPRPACTVALGVADHRHRPDHEHLPQIAVAGFGDAPRRSLPPLKFCPGTSPIHTARSRPDLKIAGSTTLATRPRPWPAVTDVQK